MPAERRWRNRALLLAAASAVGTLVLRLSHHVSWLSRAHELHHSGHG